jgi:hypothetical protein
MLGESEFALRLVVAKSAQLRFRLTAKTALAPLLLLSKPNPLRWASIWCEHADAKRLYAATRRRRSQDRWVGTRVRPPRAAVSTESILVQSNSVNVGTAALGGSFVCTAIEP